MKVRVLLFFVPLSLLAIPVFATQNWLQLNSEVTSLYIGGHYHQALEKAKIALELAKQQFGYLYLQGFIFGDWQSALPLLCMIMV